MPESNRPEPTGKEVTGHQNIPLKHLKVIQKWIAFFVFRLVGLLLK